MGCGSTHLKMDGKIIRQENIELEISDICKNNKDLYQAQSLIHLITNIRNKIIYEYDNLIYISGACLFKNPSISHCTKCILSKVCSESDGDLNNVGFSYREDPPFFKLKLEKFSQETQDLIKKLFEFTIRLRDYKIILKQIDKETPKLIYIVFENNNNESKENINKINKAILLFKDLSKLRTNILIEYKNQIYDLIMGNRIFCNQVNKIGEEAYKNKITDIYDIAMLFKKHINDEDFISNVKKEEWAMYNSINEAKKIMEKKLQKEKVEEIASPLLTFSFKKIINSENKIENNKEDSKS